MTISQALELAIQRHQAGRLVEAEKIYRQILAAQPNQPDALHFLGVIAQQVGRHEVAVKLIQQSIALHPDNPTAHGNLGEAYRTMGRLDEAIAASRRALELKPDFPEAHNSLAMTLRERGQIDESISACRRALELKPDFPEAHNNLGIALRQRGQFDEAIAACRRALALRPDFPEAHNNLGNAHRGRGQLSEAVAADRRAIALKPDYPEAYNNLGAALAGQGQLDQALSACLRARQLKPDLPEAHHNLGNAHKERGEMDEAIAAYGRALELKADFPETLNNLGATLAGQGRVDEAIATYRKALALDPHNAAVHSNLLYTLHFHPGYDERMISEERRRWNRQFAEPLKRFITPHANDHTAERRLRVGYVSPDFRDHVVGRNLVPLFERHDHRNFEIFCYSGVVRADQLTEAFRRRADHWRSTAGLGDEALADLIRQDEVDILVDLSQHMAGNRLPVFARQPAPVQVSFAGYPESAGLETIEYRISDRFLEASSGDEGSGGTERICFIDSFWCYDPCGVELTVNSLPAQASGALTFGCLNHFRKINERTLSLWAGVLRQNKDFRLLLSSAEGSQRVWTLEALAKEGVEARQVEFVGFRPRREYLELYHRLDIALDTFPYNGHTTSLDALWMGVPVVSLVGNAPVSRAGLSQLTNLGLPELAASSETEFVNIAENLARDLPRLVELRANLRDRMERSVLMDAPRFARNIEAAYRSMWERMNALRGNAPV